MKVGIIGAGQIGGTLTRRLAQGTLQEGSPNSRDAAITAGLGFAPRKLALPTSKAAGK